MYMAQNLLDIEAAYRTAKLTFAETPLEKPEYPLRVGIVGDFYTALDPFSNLEVEQKLADMGVEVWRWTNLTNRMLHYTGDKNLHVSVADRLTYNMGANSISDLWSAQSYAADGFDGILHIKSANCTPEIDIMPVLQNISADYKVPVLYLTYDSQTSDVGLMTRLEAFYDMIEMRKKVAV
jgi:predicted nucleotide-binding protein (sugar kinase/HSP70/actin superfamily)